MKTVLSRAILISLGLSTVCLAEAEEQWFVRPWLALSQMSDISAVASNIDQLSGDANINLDSGFAAGLGLGYQFNSNLALELAWEYRSNQSQTVIANQSRFEEGNYASNMFFLNGIYHFSSGPKWRPYVGAGISWVQEVDIDLERAGRETSYSASGDSGFQLFTGIGYQWHQDWILQTELRYGSDTGIVLDGENNEGRLSDLDYKTASLQFSVMYRF